MALDPPQHQPRNLLPGEGMVIDTDQERRFVRLIRIAKHTFNVPIAFICMGKGQGLSPEGVNALHAMGSEAQEAWLIPNALCQDYAGCLGNANGAQSLRFYAEAPIILAKKQIGRLCIMDYQARTLGDDDLAILHDLACCVRDEFKKMPKGRFQEQGQHLRAVLDTVIDGILTIDDKGIIQTINKATENIFGYTAGEMLGNNVNMLMPEPFHGAHDSYLDNYLTSLKPKMVGVGRNVFGRKKNGGIFPMNLATGILKNPDTIQFVGIVRDISEQKKNQQALKEFKYALDHIDDLVFMAKIDTLQFTYVNDSAKQHSGYNGAELLSMTITDLNAELSWEFIQQQVVTRLLANEMQCMTKESFHRHKNGELIPVESKIQILTLSGYKPRLFAVVRNISERKALERMKNQFVSTVSHELRTPLTSVRGALGLVLGGALGEVPEQMRDLLGMANRNSERLTLLINDLLDLEKIESEQMAFSFENIDLKLLIHQAVEANQAYAAQYAVTLQFHAPPQPIWVNADPHRLLQVLANFLSNACKFSHRGGVVNITVAAQADSYKVSVQDFGVGIPQAFRSRIFGRFAQADSADNRQKGGSGLGLSISKAIIERHEGRVGFDSSASLGTTFYFTLPTKTMKPMAALPQAKDDAQGQAVPMCLVLGNSADHIHNKWGGHLGREGLAYDVAGSMEEAKTLLGQKRYALMLLDLAMPNPNSIAIIHELRNLPNTAEMSIVIVALNGETHNIPAMLPTSHLPPAQLTHFKKALHLALRDNKQIPTLLHVEDDLDIIQLVRRILDNTPLNYHAASTLAEARHFLKSHTVDLLILDLVMPDGSGISLLAELGELCPVIVFSAHDTNELSNSQVAAILMKSTTDNEKLLTTIYSVLNDTTANTGKENP